MGCVPITELMLAFVISIRIIISHFYSMHSEVAIAAAWLTSINVIKYLWGCHSFS